MIYFRDIEALSCGGSGTNEDAFGSTPSVLVVVDGATGLADSNHTPFLTDAQWFSTHLARAVIAHSPDPSVPLVAVLERSIADCSRELKTMGVARDADLPSASVVIARCGNDHIEVLNLGDCTTLVSLRNGEVIPIVDGAVERLDDGVIDAARLIAEQEGMSVRDALRQLEHQLLSNRALRNKPQGYWIADPTGAGLRHSEVRRFPVEDVREIALMTDGYAANCTLTQQCASWADLASQLHRWGGGKLMQELIRALDHDPDFNRYPRLKARDDATFLRGTVAGVPDR